MFHFRGAFEIIAVDGINSVAGEHPESPSLVGELPVQNIGAVRPDINITLSHIHFYYKAYCSKSQLKFPKKLSINF